MPEYRVDFLRPHDANPRRKAKVFTFTLAKDATEARRKVLAAHPGSVIVKVEEVRR